MPFAFSNKLSALISVSALVLLVNAQTPPACLRTYVVQENDYCDKISAQQGVSTYQLAAANPGINVDCTNIWVGQTLCLAREGLDCSPVVVVASGDTCELIATRAGTTYANILANNPNVNEFCSNIYPGQVLCTKV